jgi:hypothetical protein
MLSMAHPFRAFLAGSLVLLVAALGVPRAHAAESFWNVYREGEQAYRDGRWADCAERFWRASHLKPASADALWNAAVCVEQTGDLPRARGLYRDYLALHGRAGAIRRRALEALEAVDHRLATLARDRPPLRRRPGEGLLPSRPRQSPDAPSLEAVAGVALQDEGPHVVVKTGWALLAIGIGISAAGVATYAHAGSLSHELDNPTRDAAGNLVSPTEREWNAYRQQVLIEEPVAISALSVGGAMLVTGIVLLALDESIYLPSVGISPAGPTLTIAGRF